jgi:hypothetical protein
MAINVPTIVIFCSFSSLSARASEVYNLDENKLFSYQPLIYYFRSEIRDDVTRVKPKKMRRNSEKLLRRS